MNKKKFLLLSLDDDKTKKIANVVNNKTSKLILEYLSEKDATETQIAQNLNLPISSVHYNLQQLLEAKLIDWENYHYSEKGKEVKHYTLANKYIIIAPKEEKASIIEQLKKIIPGFILTIIGAGVIETYLRLQNTSQELSMMAADTTAKSMKTTENFAAGEAMPRAIEQTPSLLTEPTLFFIVGAVFILVISFLLSLKREVKETN